MNQIISKKKLLIIPANTIVSINCYLYHEIINKHMYCYYIIYFISF